MFLEQMIYFGPMLSRITKNAISITTMATYCIYRKTEFVWIDKETNKIENPKLALHLDRNERKHKERCLFISLRAKKPKLSVKGQILFFEQLILKFIRVFAKFQDGWPNICYVWIVYMHNIIVHILIEMSKSSIFNMLAVIATFFINMYLQSIENLQ